MSIVVVGWSFFKFQLNLSLKDILERRANKVQVSEASELSCKTRFCDNNKEKMIDWVSIVRHSRRRFSNYMGGRAPMRMKKRRRTPITYATSSSPNNNRSQYSCCCSSHVSVFVFVVLFSRIVHFLFLVPMRGQDKYFNILPIIPEHLFYYSYFSTATTATIRHPCDIVVVVLFLWILIFVLFFFYLILVFILYD